MKDNFSTQSAQYAAYRPTYPQAFFDYLAQVCTHQYTAWDCGTGNGQVAVQLAKIFDKVYATDISEAQIAQATYMPNIAYSIQSAESTNFPDDFFDLIIAAQAIHWFDFDKFYAEVNRTAKTNAIVAAIGYGRLEITPSLDEVINDFYRNKIGTYWDAERSYIDQNYQTIPFPFQELPAPHFTNTYDWTFEHLIGYLKTWSAVKHFTKANHYNPVDELKPALAKVWGTAITQKVNFPLLLRFGKVRS